MKPFFATVQRVYELQQVACIVNVNPFGVYELCTRPFIFIYPRTDARRRSFLKYLHSLCNVPK